MPRTVTIQARTFRKRMLVVGRADKQAHLSTQPANTPATSPLCGLVAGISFKPLANVPPAFFGTRKSSANNWPTSLGVFPNQR
ncbi:hypothetical protein Poly41_57780 [Novipirellula artificiosorum]|uniref:Uncharacterized protein n=1 Tax=Novipirellula artificiosorum TaxID=2528016 RepID=A0A5C6D5Q8_9BACT|nr:hypothetical protein Poly41_57780 [Novipirellula artificiosorum]